MAYVVILGLVVWKRLNFDRCLVGLCLKVRALREHAGGAGDGEYL